MMLQNYPYFVESPSGNFSLLIVATSNDIIMLALFRVSQCGNVIKIITKKY